MSLTNAQKQQAYRERQKQKAFMNSLEVRLLLSNAVDDTDHQRIYDWLVMMLQEWGVEMTRRATILVTPFMVVALARKSNAKSVTKEIQYER